MRYIANASGYLQEVSFGADITCGGTDCTEYTGAVPTGYTSLEDWYCQEGEKLYRWKIVGGQLTLDSAATAPVEKSSCVCEVGTSGIYTFRKWSDGTKECWCTGTASRAISGSSGITGLVISTSSIYGTYPTGLFSSPPACKIELQGITSGTTEYNGWFYTVATGTAARTPQVRIARIGSAITSATVTYSVYAIGK